MKVVHLCLGNYYADGYSYQENLLPKFHKQLGYEVEVIASMQSFDAAGKVCYLQQTSSYINEHGIRVTRLPYKWDNAIGHKLKRFVGTYDAIKAAAPDILFIHNVQFLDSDVVGKYLKAHPNVVAYADNHADFANSATNWVSKNILHKVLWKRCAQVLKPYIKRFYGVLPARVRFLTEVYGLPEDQCALLEMGVDDEVAERTTLPQAIADTRAAWGVEEEDFMMVTGGKINSYRPETLNLMRAVIQSADPKLKLLVFGVVAEELKAEFNELCKDSRIIFAGWKTPEETNYIMAAANLVVFPGLHSVMWEQAVGLGVPCVFRKIPGFDHVDLDGNAVFIEDTSTNAIQKVIEEIAGDPVRQEKMRATAREQGRNVFSYRQIAMRSIQ